ncbi:hypothetical protein PYW08_014465 [Mythimna loreyi]|uniref:Uncharacterized protein n=1 Tax=Mythimna loreyi TaxID=667449 RepID=A0ACC2R460_9NEOP|nr:hypothetical protein PYW08_014465 [Mythimna loreyi]
MPRVQRSPPVAVTKQNAQQVSEPISTTTAHSVSNIKDVTSNVSVRSKRPRLNDSPGADGKCEETLEESLTSQDASPESHILNKAIISELRKEIESVLTLHLQASLKAYFENEFIQLKKTLQGLEESVEFIGKEYDVMKIELNQNKEVLSQLKKENDELKTCVSDLSVRLNIVEQHSRQDNIELNGIPENQAENLLNTVLQLGKIISCNINAEDVSSVTRVKKMDVQSSRPRSVIVKLKNARKRDEILASVTKFNRAHVSDKLNSSHLGYGGAKQPVFVSEHLSPLNKAIHAQARKLAREKGYKYVWVRDGRILVRKDDGARPMHIKSLQAATLM